MEAEEPSAVERAIRGSRGGPLLLSPVAVKGVAAIVATVEL